MKNSGYWSPSIAGFNSGLILLAPFEFSDTVSLGPAVQIQSVFFVIAND
jgi:hypothetical protein